MSIGEWRENATPSAEATFPATRSSSYEERHAWPACAHEGREKRRTDFQPGGHRLSSQPAGRWAVAPPPIGSVPHHHRSPLTVFSILISFASLTFAAPSTSLLLRLPSRLAPHVRAFPAKTTVPSSELGDRTCESASSRSTVNDRIRKKYLSNSS